MFLNTSQASPAPERYQISILYRNTYPAPEKYLNTLHRNRIVIVNSRFLERTQKRSRRNQLIRRCLSKKKSIGSGSDPESQAGTGRQSDSYGGWCLELRRSGR